MTSARQPVANRALVVQNVIKAALIAIALALAVPVAAQDIDAGFEAYQRGDYAAALREYRPLAEQGNASAQYNLGVMYVLGQGLPQDYANAVTWFRNAAARGHANAQHYLGYLNEKGHGTAQDYAEALRWYRKAADQGNARAQT